MILNETLNPELINYFSDFISDEPISTYFIFDNLLTDVIYSWALLHVSIHRGSNTCYFILDLLQILLLTLSECKRIIKLLVPLKSSKNNKSLIVETKFGDDLFAFT